MRARNSTVQTVSSLCFHVHGSPENICVRGFLPDEFVLFFLFSFKIDIVERRSRLGGDSDEYFAKELDLMTDKE